MINNNMLRRKLGWYWDSKKQEHAKLREGLIKKVLDFTGVHKVTLKII